MMLLFFIDSDRDEYLCQCISCDMEIDEVSPSRFDVDAIRELDIFFLESDIELIGDLGSYTMLIESSEDFFSLSFQGELDFLSVELLLYLKCLLETLSRLILEFLFISFYLHETIWGDLSGNPSWDQRVASLWGRYIYDRPLAADMRDILQELYGDLVYWHRE